MKRRIMAGVFLLAATAAAAQQIYRWTDKNGRVHVTDTPPPPGVKDVRVRGAGGAAQPGGNEPYAIQIARKTNPVTLYSTPGCEACNEARKLLNERGVPFKEISVDSQKQLEELKAAVGSNSVPSLIVGATVQKGFESAAYHGILDAAGYPKTGLLPPRTQSEPPAQPPPPAPTSQTDAEPAPAEAPTSGPYAPGAPPQRAQKK